MHSMVRMAVRNLLYPLNEAEMRRELELSIELNDSVRADCVREYMQECGFDGFDVSED